VDYRRESALLHLASLDDAAWITAFAAACGAHFSVVKTVRPARLGAPSQLDSWAYKGAGAGLAIDGDAQRDSRFMLMHHGAGVGGG